MSKLYSKNFNYILQYNAKSGCSYLRKLFLELHKDELEFCPKNDYHDVVEYFPVPPDIDVVNTPKIMVVRNPFSRAVSMFLNKFIEKDSPIKRSIQKNNDKIPNNTFIDFLFLLKEIKDKKLLNIYDFHIKEQSNEYININTNIVKLETINHKLEHAFKKTIKKNKKNFFKRFEKIFKNHKIINETNYDLKNKEFVSNKLIVQGDKFPHPFYFYNKECCKLVVEIYEKDFINFGYSTNLKNFHSLYSKIF